MSRKKLQIGLFGFGCAGFGLYEVLKKTPALQANIKQICVRQKDKKRPIGSEHFSFDKADILGDPEINVVVELIDDADAAFVIVCEALRAGKCVVSANKKMIAHHLQELLDLQRRHGGSLLYEAACCASIPVIRNMEEYYDNDLLESVEGIVNGSTNYILSKISSTNSSYAEALAEAQHLGYAESDPSLDVEGHDAVYKLNLLLVHAFGIFVNPADIFRLGINRIGPAEQAYAREKGYKIKLVARAIKEGDTVQAYVMPEFIRPQNKLYNVDGVFNGVRLNSCFSDAQFFEGRGAGAHPTASAVISDISALSYNYAYEYKKLGTHLLAAKEHEIYVEVFFRHAPANAVRIRHAFDEVHTTHQEQDVQYLTGVISLGALRGLLDHDPSCSCILLQHKKNYVAMSVSHEQIAFID